jgi:bifunctional DNA-binding transcriptional regulator/antitoxin component of YhaV-PrlF toxin-antitoxin module
MLSKITSKNQLTIPKEVIKNFPSTEYFEIVAENGA